MPDNPQRLTQFDHDGARIEPQSFGHRLAPSPVERAGRPLTPWQRRLIAEQVRSDASAFRARTGDTGRVHGPETRGDVQRRSPLYPSMRAAWGEPHEPRWTIEQDCDDRCLWQVTRDGAIVAQGFGSAAAASNWIDAL